MNKRFIEKLAISALLGGALWAAPLSVQAADESSQVLMLRRVFATSVEYWPDILKTETKLLDKSFFERIEARLKWSIDNGQIEDAVRFAYVGDLAGRIVNHKTTYRMQMAQLFRKIGNYSMAMDVINNVCITEPDNNDAIFYRASLLQDGGDNVHCYKAYEELAKKNYRRAECYYRMSLLELQRDEIEMAHNHLKDCLKLDPKHNDAKKVLSKLEAALAKATFIPQSGDPGSALPVASAGQIPIATSDASKAMALANDANKALQDGSVSEAKDLYNRALELDSKSAQAMIGRGFVAYRNGDVEEALLNFTAASQCVKQPDANLEHYLGCCYERRYDLNKNPRDLESARAHFQSCQKIDPNHPLVTLDLERIANK